ncbi:MAG: tetratricopeptide repeat protein [Elusimicrobia bacterium]|nr:tetratricopeptide repeat protein [Elusimicrobiota bacterium]
MSGPIRLVLATRNAHKIAEISRFLRDAGVSCLELDAYPGVPEVVEDRATLEGNAEKKALETAAACGAWALADDTGLEVAALGGAPGVRSARWAGPGCSYDDNCGKLLRELAGVAPARRGARFRTVLALADPERRVERVEGRLVGFIADSPRGRGGFGYDPLFLLPDGRALAELTLEEKNAVSHRGRALAAFLPALRRWTAAAAFALLAAAAPARAGRTEPGQRTVWDEIMAAQARRGLRQAQGYLEEKRYDLALEETRRAVAADPKDPLGHLLLGVAQYWSGLVDDSIASYKTAVALEPDNAQGHLLLGISYAWKEDAAAAEGEFRRAVELDPSRADAQMNLGSLRQSLGDYPSALERFRKAAELDKRSPLYRFQLGSIYRRLGRDEDAAAEFSEAVRLEPSYEDALLELGCAQDRLGRGKDAAATLRKAVDLKPGDSVARLRLALLHIAAGQGRKARGVMAEAFRLTPEEGGGGLQLNVAYAGARAPAAAAPSGGKGVQEPRPRAEPEPSDPLSLFERNLRRLPLDQDAVMHVDAVFLPRPKLLREGPAEGSSLRRAFARAESGGASAAPRAARRDYPLSAGDAKTRQAQIRAILDDLRGVMSQAPPDSDARLGMNLTYARPVDVARLPARAPKVSYEPRRVGNDMGLWVIGTGWMELAAEVIPEPGEEAAAGRADDADWWTALGLAHAAVGESQLAAEAFLRATRLDPRSAPAWLGRGVAAAMAGDEDGAVAALKKALELEPRNRAAADGLKWLLRPADAVKEKGS